MSTHHHPFAAQEPPSDFADRVVGVMLEERAGRAPRAQAAPQVGPHELPARRRGGRLGFLALAAFFVGASAWAGLNESAGRSAEDDQLVVPRLVEVSAPAVERAETPRPTKVAPAPVAEAPPDKRTVRGHVSASAPAVIDEPPRVMHFPRCSCAVGVEMCGCVE